MPANKKALASGPAFSALSPALKTQLATAACALGLALSAYLALLKVFSLPCIGPGHCGAIVFSLYGSFYGMPVGVFGFVLWSGAILTGDRSRRGALLLLLALGSAGFMGIQFLILRGFCLYCTLHALSALAAAFLHGDTPRKWAFPFGLVLAASGFFLTRHYIAAQVYTVADLRESHPLDCTKALPWLGAISAKSPALVISLNCPACLDLLEKLDQLNYPQLEKGPALFFKTTEENRTLTVEFVAAVLSRTGSRRDTFLAVNTLFLTLKDTALSAPSVAVTQLSALFPDAANHRDEAEQALAVQKDALTLAHVPETTPLLISADGKTRAFFEPTELFPK